MGETVHIGEMAEKLSNDLFAEFLWEKVGPTNQNWPCVLGEKHGAKTHPADVVFFYDEPYQARRTYVHCDLKSYAKGTIKAPAIKDALASLAQQIECAEQSADWQSLYLHKNVNPAIVGLLFVYNHDNEYDQDFSSLTRTIDSRNIQTSVGARLHIFGPDDIFWLNNVRCEIRSMRGDGKLAERGKCRFFYPNTVRQVNLRPEIARAANLEMLSSPWIILDSESIVRGFSRSITIFYRRNATDTEEFVYLIDYLRQMQLLLDDIRIEIKFMPSNSKASILFQKACDEYIEHTFSKDQEFEKIINAIIVSPMENIITTFSTVNLGMNYENA